MKIEKTTASKRQTRRELAELPFDEKLCILERLRDDLVIGLENARADDGTDVSTASKDTKSLFLNLVDHTVESGTPGREVKAGSDEERKLAAEVDAMSVDRKLARLALRRLFPEGVVLDQRFWDRLSDLQLRLGWGETSHKAVGLLLLAAVETVPRPQAEMLLRGVIEVRSPHFFQLLYSLATPLTELDITPSFAAEWFPALVRRIGNDMGAGGFWTALRRFSEHHPPASVQILSLLGGGRSEEEIAVAAYILGTLRCVTLDAQTAGRLAEVETALRLATAISARSIYYRSWLQTAWCGKMQIEDLRTLTETMWAGRPEEREQVFWVVCRSMLSPSLPSDARQFGWEWLRNHVGADLSAVAKHNVIDFAAQVSPDRYRDAATLLLAVQPILAEHTGTWGRIEHFLVELLNKDIALFRMVLRELAVRNGEGLFQVLREPRQLEWLLSEMRTRDIGDSVTELIFSRTSASRRVGIALFEKLMLSLPPRRTRASETLVALVFYEVQRSTMIQATAIARLLMLLVPSVEWMPEPLRDEFYDELVLQLKNYPGGCKEEFEAHAAEFPILQQAVKEVEGYFDALKAPLQSGISQIAVPGLERAARLHARRFSNQISKGAEEMSIFSQLVKKVRLIYGKNWRTFHDGVLGESSALKSFSTSMEFPRMEFIDPEGMQLRRFHASFRIRELSDKAEVKN